MEIQYTAIFFATVAQFILGAFWYSPLLFGKWWMQIMETTRHSKEELKKLQKEMAPFYTLQFFLMLFMTLSFANLIRYIPSLTTYTIGFWIWVGFVVPVQVAGVIWGNTKKRYWIKQIFIMTSMQLVGIMLAAWILSV
jgi:Protein of unknown function (DUF1761)